MLVITNDQSKLISNNSLSRTRAQRGLVLRNTPLGAVWSCSHTHTPL